MLDLTPSDHVEIDRELCRRKFSRFLRLAWPSIDPEQYLHNWHMDCLGEHLQAVASGEINRIVFNVPPGTSKSSAISVFFPAWMWGPFGKPSFRFIGASHEQTLATRDNLRTRRLIQSEWYQRRWPIRMTTDQNEKTYFENDKFGFRQSSAVASMTGKRGHAVGWDDPLNPESANSDVERETANRIFAETLTSRLVNPTNSSIIIIMQRLHEEDVTGYILARDLGYEHVMLPMEFEPERRCHTAVRPTYMKAEKVRARYHAKSMRWWLEGETPPEKVAIDIADKPFREVYPVDPRTEEGELLHPERFPPAIVARDNKQMGSYAAAGQQQQRPVPRGGALFHRHWFKFLPERPAGVRWVRAWDLAGTDDEGAAWTRGVLVGLRGSESDGYEVIIGGVVGIQGTPAQVDALILSTAKTDGRSIPGSLPQDPGQAGKSQVTALVRKLVGYNYTFSPESGDKVTRARPLASQAEAGNLYLVEGAWNADYVEELCAFPRGKWADQVDASSRGLAYLLETPDYESGSVEFRL